MNNKYFQKQFFLKRLGPGCHLDHLVRQSRLFFCNALDFHLLSRMSDSFSSFFSNSNTGFPLIPCSLKIDITSSELSGFEYSMPYADANLFARPVNVVWDWQVGVLFARSDIATQTAKNYTSPGKWMCMSMNLLTGIFSLSSTLFDPLNFIILTFQNHGQISLFHF